MQLDLAYFQLALWDQYKFIADPKKDTPIHRTINLARLTAHLIIHNTLSLTTLKVVDWNDVNPSNELFLTQLLYTILTDTHNLPDTQLDHIFTRVAENRELDDLRSGMAFYIQKFLISRQVSAFTHLTDKMYSIKDSGLLPKDKMTRRRLLETLEERKKIVKRAMSASVRL